MAKVILITGGVSSGKSEFACKLVGKNKKVCFIATAQRSDSEMREKINRHVEDRPKGWFVIESGKNRLDKLENFANVVERCDAVIVDCLTLYVSTMFMKRKMSSIGICESIKAFIEIIKGKEVVKKLIIVTNEVGLGIVPVNRNARIFRELLGQVNKTASSLADEVYFMICGISNQIK